MSLLMLIALLIISLVAAHCFYSSQDGHEICFVGDEGFRELSKIDPNADQLINDVRLYVEQKCDNVIGNFVFPGDCKG